mgnify:CR=1 FL=1
MKKKEKQERQEQVEKIARRLFDLGAYTVLEAPISKETSREVKECFRELRLLFAD